MVWYARLNFSVTCRSQNIQVCSMGISFESARLVVVEFEMKDAEELFSCISPAVATFMPWEPPRSVDDLKARRQELACSASAGDFRFVIRSKATAECLGAIHNPRSWHMAARDSARFRVCRRDYQTTMRVGDREVQSARLHLSGSGGELAKQAHRGAPWRRRDRAPH